MNRHERRKQRAQQRKAKRTDTMGAGYSSGPLPASVTQHPAFKEGVRSAKTGRMPQRYYDDVEQAAQLMFEWVKAQPAPPKLRWLEQKNDGVFLAAALDVGAQYLADSPAAFALLAWVDEKMEHRLSLNQATWALRRCRAIPMPDGSYHGVETTRESDASKSLRYILERVMSDAAERDRVATHPCPHCGALLDGASSIGGHRPNPDDLSVCVYCAGINRFDAELRPVAFTDADVEALGVDHPEAIAQLREMQALLREAIMARGQQKGPAAEA